VVVVKQSMLKLYKSTRKVLKSGGNLNHGVAMYGVSQVVVKMNERTDCMISIDCKIYRENPGWNGSEEPVLINRIPICYLKSYKTK